MKIILTILISFSLQISFAQGVDSLSAICLKLDVFSNASNLNSATGFIIQKHNKNYLITNLHVVTGADFFSKAKFDPQLRSPNMIAIWHNLTTLGKWFRYPEPLYDKHGKKRWIECSYAGKTLDLVALPLTNLPDSVKLYPLDTNHYNTSMKILTGYAVSIIGFPNGLSSDGVFAIWKTGHIASDMVLDPSGIPQFMIDATTRPGMSGSIVLIRMQPYLSNNGDTNLGIGTKFLGVYTSQSTLEEIGYVLKPIALRTLIDQLP